MVYMTDPQRDIQVQYGQPLTWAITTEGMLATPVVLITFPELSVGMEYVWLAKKSEESASIATFVSLEDKQDTKVTLIFWPNFRPVTQQVMSFDPECIAGGRFSVPSYVAVIYSRPQT